MDDVVWNYRHACHPRELYHNFTRKHFTDLRHIQQLLLPNIGPQSGHYPQVSAGLSSADFMTDDYEASNRSFAVSMTWAAAVLTGVVCYLGFWYQKMLRRAVAVELDRQ